jgi:hypothetical protein
MEGQQTNDALALFTAGVDALIGTELASLTAVEVTGLLTGIEAQRRRLEAVDQRILAEIGERGIAGEYARTSPGGLVGEPAAGHPAGSPGPAGPLDRSGPAPGGHRRTPRADLLGGGGRGARG